MLTLKLTDIANSSFSRAVSKLANNEKLPKEVAYRAGRLLAVTMSEQKKAQAVAKEIYLKHQLLDANGRPLLTDGVPTYKEADGEEKANAEIDKWVEEKLVDVKVHKLDYNEIQGLSGAELVALTPVLENLPSEEEKA